MGEYVWTAFTVGGKVTRDIVEGLTEVGYGDATSDVRSAIEKKTSATFEGECNYGNPPDELIAFCKKSGLPFHYSWAACPGQFNSRAAYWREGDDIWEYDADDSGSPCASLAELKRARDIGQSLIDVIDELSKFDAGEVPPLELIEENPPCQS
jgi:hypothetical protein